MTSPARFAEIKRLFELECDLPADTQRARLLAENQDAQLVAEVVALLGAQTQSLKRAAVPVNALLEALPETELGAGDRIGAWRLERRLASGGMGAVYLAERADGHFQQRSAIKLLRGLPTADALTHLAAERQILAALQHPHIARLLDGGATPGGQPYLVMEYIDGMPIDRYCHEHALDLAGRVRLFQRVCRAVQFAHQRLIVHCDLKPSNVLVRADGTPALLDFGIARALDRAGGAANAEPGGSFFTPSYASPEQIQGEQVSTTSDIYSLGLILFELLTGRKARLDADDHTVTQLGRAERRPSELAIPAACPWQRQLRGDLDAIVLRATAAAPGARYASADALADDLQRYLEFHPVLARAPTRRYRYARLLRRRWGVVAAVGLFTLLSAVFTWRVIAERDRALSAEHTARVHADTAQQVSDFLVSVFEVANPEVNQKRDVTAREVLDQGADRIDHELRDQPAVRAKLLDVLARAYWMLGRSDQAVDLYRRAAELWLSPALKQPLAAAESLSKLAVVQSNNSRADVAEHAARQALALRAPRLAPDDPDMADSWNTLALILGEQGKFAEAEADYQKALAIRSGRFGPESLEVATTLSNMGLLYKQQGRLTASEDVTRRALELKRRAHGDDHPNTLLTLENLARTLSQDGKVGEAIPLLTQALAQRKQLSGELSGDVGRDYNELGSALHDAGRFAEAAENYRAAMQIDQQLGESGSVALLQPLNNLASAYEDMGDYAQAEPLFRQSLALRRKSYADDDPVVARAKHNLARLLTEQDKLDEAKPLLDQSRTARVAKLGPAHQEVAKSELLRADWLRRKGDLDAAQAVLEAVGGSAAPVTPLMTAQRWRMLGLIADARSQSAVALEDFRQAYAVMVKNWGEAHPLSAQFALDYAVALLSAGQLDAARALIEATRPIVETAFFAQAPIRRELERLAARMPR